jgi:hypothetical protein
MAVVASASDEGNRPRAVLVGNSVALIGAVVYLLEWVAIVGSSPPGPFGPAEPAGTVVHEYATHAGRAGVAAGLFAVVLLGRVLFVAGVAGSLRGQPALRPLLDTALVAMGASVLLEVVAYAIVAANARLALAGATSSVVVGLDQAAYWVDLLLAGPVGVSVLLTAWAMVRSRAFVAWLGWLGVLSGVTWLLACLVTGTALDNDDAGLLDAVTTVGALTVWVWMLATGIVLLRARRPGTTGEAGHPA